MLAPILTRLLNHIISQNIWAKDLLLPYAGKSLRLNLAPLHANLIVLEDGGLAIAGQTGQPEATVTIPLTLALRILANEPEAMHEVKIEGDTEFATGMSKVLKDIRWDYEEDISHWMGDATAHQITSTLEEVITASRQRSQNITEMLTEFWQEEVQILAKKHHIETFGHDVDTLVADVDRLDKRIQKLQLPRKSARQKKESRD